MHWEWSFEGRKNYRRPSALSPVLASPTAFSGSCVFPHFVGRRDDAAQNIRLPVPLAPPPRLDLDQSSRIGGNARHGVAPGIISMGPPSRKGVWRPQPLRQRLSGVFRPFPTLLCPANSSQFYLLAKNLGPNLYPRKNPVVAPVHWPESAYAVGRVGNDGGCQWRAADRDCESRCGRC